MNKLIITGRLTRDAELRYIPSGTAVLSFSVANNTGYGKNEKTHFFNCSLFGKRAEGRLKEFLSKGKQVLVEGEVSLNTYQKRDGGSGASLNLLVNDVELLGGSSQVEAESNQESSFPPSNSPVKDNVDSLNDDDDVPF